MKYVSYLTIFLSLMICLSSCSSIRTKNTAYDITAQVVQPKDLHSGEILVVGKVRFVPELRYEKPSAEPGGKPTIATDALTYLVCTPYIPTTLPNNAAIFFYGFYARQGSTFITRAEKSKTLYFRGFLTMIDSSYAFPTKDKDLIFDFPINHYGCFKIEVPRNAKAIYIGTIALGRTEFYEPNSFKVIDEYDEASEDLHKTFPNLQLVRADMSFIEPPVK